MGENQQEGKFVSYEEFAELQSLVKANTEATEKLVASIAGLIEAWETGASILKVARLFGALAKWLTAIGVMVGGAWYLFTGHKP